jgi:hypothetical protein
MGLVGAAMVVAQRVGLRETFMLDWRGTATEGSAERIGEDRYRLSHRTPAAIQARTYTGNIPVTRAEGKRFPVKLVYNPADPSEFQPRGLSYVPTAIVAVLFVGGMGCVLYARRIVHRIQHPKAAPRPSRRYRRRTNDG